MFEEKHKLPQNNEVDGIERKQFSQILDESVFDNGEQTLFNF